MGKVLRCREVGVDCDFEARGDTVDEILASAAKHARDDHGMDEIPPELMEKVMQAIQDE